MRKSGQTEEDSHSDLFKKKVKRDYLLFLCNGSSPSPFFWEVFVIRVLSSLIRLVSEKSRVRSGWEQKAGFESWLVWGSQSLLSAKFFIQSLAMVKAPKAKVGHPKPTSQLNSNLRERNQQKVSAQWFEISGIKRSLLEIRS